DLNLAPRNAKGMVEYSATFQLARPVDASKDSGVLIYNTVNRGNGGVSGSQDGHLSLVSGWQGDIPPARNLPTRTLPVAGGRNGAPVTGPTIARGFDGPAGTTTVPLNGGQGVGVPRPPPLNLNSPKDTLYRMVNDKAKQEPLPRDSWTFADCT